MAETLSGKSLEGSSRVFPRWGVRAELEGGIGVHLLPGNEGEAALGEGIEAEVAATLDL